MELDFFDWVDEIKMEISPPPRPSHAEKKVRRSALADLLEGTSKIAITNPCHPSGDSRRRKETDDLSGIDRIMTNLHLDPRQDDWDLPLETLQGKTMVVEPKKVSLKGSFYEKLSQTHSEEEKVSFNKTCDSALPMQKSIPVTNANGPGQSEKMKHVSPGKSAPHYRSSGSLPIPHVSNDQKQNFPYKPRSPKETKYVYGYVPTRYPKRQDNTSREQGKVLRNPPPPKWFKDSYTASFPTLPSKPTSDCQCKCTCKLRESKLGYWK